MMRIAHRSGLVSLIFGVLILACAPFALAQTVPTDPSNCPDNAPESIFNPDTGQWEANRDCTNVVVVVGGDDFTFKDLVYGQIIPFIDGYLIQALYALAFAFFIYGMFKFFFTGGEENRQRGRQFAVWGIIGFVALFSVWSLVMLLLQSFSPSSAWNGRTPVGNVPSGGRCSSGRECQSGVCTLRGINTSTCE